MKLGTSKPSNKNQGFKDCDFRSSTRLITNDYIQLYYQNGALLTDDDRSILSVFGKNVVQ